MAMVAPSDYFGFRLPETARFVAIVRGSKRSVAHPYSDTNGLTWDELRRRYPDDRYHYALVLNTSGYCVVDVDVKQNPDVLNQLREWSVQHGLNGAFRHAYRVKTPSGGRHFYFRLPDGVGHGRWINALVSDGIEGVDLLTDGLVLLPRATTRDGAYELDNNLDGELPAFLPAPLAAKMTAPEPPWRAPRDRAETPTDRELKQRGLLNPFTLAAFLKSLGCRVFLKGRQIRTQCPYHADRNPSLSILVAEDKLLARCFACDSDGSSEPPVYVRLVNDYLAWNQQVRPHGDETPHIPTLAQLREVARSMPPRVGIWGDLFQKGTLTMLGGYQRDFKSTLMKNVIAAVTRGRSLNGWRTQQGKCLLVAYEEPLHYLVGRFEHLDVDPQQVVIVPREPTVPGAISVADLETDPIGVLEQWIAHYQPILVVVDTAWNFVTAAKARMNRDQSRYSRAHPTPTNEEIHAMFSRVKEIAERYQTAIVFLWHRRKGDDLGKDSLSGVRALSASADSSILIQRKEDYSPVVSLVAEGRHATIQCELEFDEARGVLIEADAPSQPEPEPLPMVPPQPIDEPVRVPVPSESLFEGTTDAYEPDELVRMVDRIQPMRDYKFQTTPNHQSVVRLRLPERASEEQGIDYYRAIAPARDWREARLKGCTILWALQGSSCFDGVDVSQLPKIVFDIEAESLNPKESRVIAIGMRFEQGERIWFESRALPPESRSDEQERQLLQWFDEQLSQFNPKWLIGYNIFKFDIPFLQHRARQLGVALSWLETNFYSKHTSFRYGSQNVDVDVWLAKRDPQAAVLDVYLLVLRADSASGGKMPNHKLYTAYEHLTGERAPVFDKSDIDTWDAQQLEELLETDVICTAIVAQRLLGVELALSSYVPLPFGELVYAGQGLRAETILIADYIRRGRAIRAERVPEASYEGAISEVLHTGIYAPVAKIDVVSLYPSIIIQERIAPRNDYDGRLPQLLAVMREARVRLKRQPDADSQLRQQALKILINSAYGFMGSPAFLFSDPEAAARVPARGRETIRTMQRVLEETGNTPLELDTDGILFAPTGDVDAAVSRLKAETPFDYDVETYQKGLILAAKNYVLVRADGSLEVKGASLRSRGEPKLVQRFLKELVMALLNEQPIAPVVEAALSSVDDAPVDDLVKVNTATDRTTLTDGCEVRRGETVYVWFDKDGNQQRTTVLPAPDQLNRDIVRDYLVQVLCRFDSLPVVGDYLLRYGGARRFLQSFLGGQSALNLIDDS